MKRFFLLFVCFIFFANSVYAQALPISAMQRAISGVIQQKAIKRGFAANDPRYGATLTSVGGYAATAAGTAAAVAVAGVTAPGWMSVLLACGIGTAVGVVVNLAVDGLIEWFFKPNSIDVSMSSGSASYAGVGQGIPLWQATTYRNGQAVFIFGGDGMALARQAYYERYGSADTPNCSGSSSYVSCVKGGNTTNAAFQAAATPPGSCPAGQFYLSGSGCAAYAFPPPVVVPTPNQTPQQAVDALPQSERSKKLNPIILAEAANLLWRNAAARPGYDGLPYAAADPITVADVVQWQHANPDLYPTVADFVAPQPSVNKPWTLPSSPTALTHDPSLNPSPGINPSTQPVQNLGNDPVIGAPVLEEPPTPKEILDPVLNLLPSFKNFSAPAHVAECPKPSFVAFDREYVMDSHCNIAESNRQLLLGLMTAVWSLCACIIVLRA